MTTLPKSFREEFESIEKGSADGFPASIPNCGFLNLRTPPTEIQPAIPLNKESLGKKSSLRTPTRKCIQERFADKCGAWLPASSFLDLQTPPADIQSDSSTASLRASAFLNPRTQPADILPSTPLNEEPAGKKSKTGIDKGHIPPDKKSFSLLSQNTLKLNRRLARDMHRRATIATANRNLLKSKLEMKMRRVKARMVSSAQMELRLVIQCEELRKKRQAMTKEYEVVKGRYEKLMRQYDDEQVAEALLVMEGGPDSIHKHHHALQTSNNSSKQATPILISASAEASCAHKSEGESNDIWSEKMKPIIDKGGDKH